MIGLLLILYVLAKTFESKAQQQTGNWTVSSEARENAKTRSVTIDDGLLRFAVAGSLGTLPPPAEPPIYKGENDLLP